MEPVSSAIGLAVSCTSLLTNIFKITSALNALVSKFQTAELAILSLISQLSSLEVSTSELELILRKHESTINQRDSLLKALRQSLESANSVISYIWDQASEAKSQVEAGRGLGRWARAKQVFNEAGLASMKEALRDQIQAIHLLLSIASLTNEIDQENALNDAESVATLERTRGDRSSLLWLRDAESRASIISYQTDTLSRLTMVFGFDGTVLDSKPYRAAVMATWKKLRQRQGDGPITSPPIPPPQTRASMFLEGRSENDISAPLGGTKGGLFLIVKYDFLAERADEMSCNVGEALVCFAISNEEWLVAKPIARLGGPGIVPLCFVSVMSRTGRVCESSEEAIRELKAVGTPSVAEWKRVMAGRNIPIARGWEGWE